MVCAPSANGLVALLAGKVVLGLLGDLRPRHLAPASEADLLAMVALDRVFFDQPFWTTFDPEIPVGVPHDQTSSNMIFAATVEA